MGCTNTAINTTTASSRNFILETIRKIDQLQKEVLLDNNCVGCEGALISRLYNTKPVSFTLCSGELFRALIGAGGTETTLFRIEEVRGNDVILRLLSIGAGAISCTNYTCIFNVDCCCGLQCFDPINCTTVD